MQRSLQTLLNYWNQLRAGRIAPHRLEIEPSRIAGVLAETFMLERVEAGTYQFRLAGTRLCELFGSELRGKNFLAGWSEQDRLVLERLLTTISEQGAAGLLTVEGVIDDRHRVEIDVNLLPLVHTCNKITRIIGAMSATSAPYWLGSEPLRGRHLKHHQTIWPDGRPHVMPVWGIWVESVFYFSTGRESRKSKNLVANPRCVICTEKAEEAVVLQGSAEEVTDAAVLGIRSARRAARWP